MRESTAPVKKAIYCAYTIPGKPKSSPIKKANFTSPNPIPFPFVPKNSARKNPPDPIAEKRNGEIALPYKNK